MSCRTQALPVQRRHQLAALCYSLPGARCTSYYSKHNLKYSYCLGHRQRAAFGPGKELEPCLLETGTNGCLLCNWGSWQLRAKVCDPGEMRGTNCSGSDRTGVLGLTPAAGTGWGMLSGSWWLHRAEPWEPPPLQPPLAGGQWARMGSCSQGSTCLYSLWVLFSPGSAGPGPESAHFSDKDHSEQETLPSQQNPRGDRKCKIPQNGRNERVS